MEEPRGSGQSRLHVTAHGVQSIPRFGASPLTSYWVDVTMHEIFRHQLCATRSQGRLRRGTMEHRQRTDKLLVVADESGNIVAAMWPGADSETDPPRREWASQTANQSYEVVVPDELHELAQTDLGKLRLKTDTPEATLIRDEEYNQ